MRFDARISTYLMLTCLTMLFAVPSMSFVQANPLYTGFETIYAGIDLPHNTTYTTHKIQLELTTGSHQWNSCAYYSIDDEPEIPININISRYATFKTTVYLEDGLHNIHLRTVELGQRCSNAYFTVNTTRPFLTLESPQNQVYNNSTIDLTYTLADNERFTAYYILDGHQNITVHYQPWASRAPQISNLADGPHHLAIYAEDDFGNVYSTETSFEVSTNSAAAKVAGTSILIALVAIIATILIALVLLVFFKKSKSRTALS